MLDKPLLVSVDVEGQPTIRDYGCVDTLSRILDSLGLPATLFVTPGVVENRTESVLNWMDQGHEIGLHIHPERTPHGDSNWLTDFDDEVKQRMIGWGINKFETELDYVPDAFRAGRWEYSEGLLEVLSDFGFEIDSSLRPHAQTPPYRRAGVRELPLSVYSNGPVKYLLRDYDLESIPMTIDAFLKRGLFVPGFYAVTARLALSSIPYLMVAFHDYDVTEQVHSDRIERYLSRLASYLRPSLMEHI